MVVEVAVVSCFGIVSLLGNLTYSSSSAVAYASSSSDFITSLLCMLLKVSEALFVGTTVPDS